MILWVEFCNKKNCHWEKKIDPHFRYRRGLFVCAFKIKVSTCLRLGYLFNLRYYHDFLSQYMQQKVVAVKEPKMTIRSTQPTKQNIIMTTTRGHKMTAELPNLMYTRIKFCTKTHMTDTLVLNKHAKYSCPRIFPIVVSPFLFLLPIGIKQN